MKSFLQLKFPFARALAAMILFFAVDAVAQTTNMLSDAEIQGRKLAQQLFEQIPATNSTETGVLKIRDGSGKTVEIPIGFRISITETNWKSYYNIRKIIDPKENNPGVTSLVVTHNRNTPNEYQFYEFFSDIKINPVEKEPVGNQAMVSFAGSDFWLCDLGLEFFHWPQQKVLKKEIKRSRGCTVLESTNPEPATNAYSRVVSWIDDESDGIVQAEAYDFNGKLLKEFTPKSFKKVNGQWQVGTMQMENVQTDSRTRLEFDLKK